MLKESAMNKFKLGIQLYTVRNELDEDFLGTLKQLAFLGFEGVEFACNYGGLEPYELAISLNALGLETYGLYESIDNIIDLKSRAYGYAATLNCKYLTCGISEIILKSDFENCLEKLKQACSAANSKGINLCYHAHAYEFDKFDSRSYLEIILQETDLLFEADTAWIHAGGENVKAYLEKHQNKIPLIHIKDITENINYTELGEGVVNFDEVVEFARNSQVKWLGYEQDSSKIGALESTKRSYKFIGDILKE